MKKNIVVSSVLAAGLLLAASAFADTSINSAGTDLGGGTFKPSNNVVVRVSTDATGTKYAAGSKHLSGDKEYATTNSDARIYYKAATVGTQAPTFGGSADAAPDSTWSPL